MSARIPELIIDRNTIFSEIFINTMLSKNTNAILRFFIRRVANSNLLGPENVIML